MTFMTLLLFFTRRKLRKAFKSLFESSNLLPWTGWLQLLGTMKFIQTAAQAVHPLNSNEPSTLVVSLCPLCSKRTIEGFLQAEYMTLKHYLIAYFLNQSPAPFTAAFCNSCKYVFQWRSSFSQSITELQTWTEFLFCQNTKKNLNSVRSGARFSKGPVTFRARNQIFKSKYKEQERGSWLRNYSILFH